MAGLKGWLAAVKRWMDNWLGAWAWKTAEFLEGKKTYISAGASTLIGAYIAFRNKGEIDWMGVVSVLVGLLTFFFRAIAKKPGALVGKTIDSVVKE